MKRTLALLLTLATCSCAAQVKPPQLVADPSIAPAFPPPPVDLNRPVSREMMPELHCLVTTGQPSGPSCPGAGSWEGLVNATSTAPKP